MKKIILASTKATLLCGVLLLTCGCQKEQIQPSTENLISFSALVQSDYVVESRAVSFTTIGIFGYSDQRDIDQLFNNEQLTQNESKWYYDPTKPQYYKTDEQINYFAYAPYSDSNYPTLSSETNTFSLEYTLSDGADDLLFAVTNVTNEANVELDFKHALSNIQFNVTNIGIYEVQSLTISPIRNKATIEINNQGEINITANEVTTESSFNVQLTCDPTGDRYQGNVYMIPQTLPANAAVTLVVKNMEDSSVKTHYIPVWEYNEWELGYQHIYTIELGSDTSNTNTLATTAKRCKI